MWKDGQSFINRMKPSDPEASPMRKLIALNILVLALVATCSVADAAPCPDVLRSGSFYFVCAMVILRPLHGHQNTINASANAAPSLVTAVATTGIANQKQIGAGDLGRLPFSRAVRRMCRLVQDRWHEALGGHEAAALRPE